MRLIIISGISGSGKSIALHTLEDSGYYCIDNLPVGLVTTVASRISSPEGRIHDKVAIGVDARNLPEELRRFPETIRELKNMGVECELVFLEAEDHTLLKRFSETRRKHPLTTQNISLGEAIRKEREILNTISEFADLHIDTSHTNMHQLRDLVLSRIEKRPAGNFSLLFQSFGYKHGIPSDADFVFDVRCLPNPHWEPGLRTLTGLDPEVIQFLKCHEVVSKMQEHLRTFLETWIPVYAADNRSYITIAIGCTGGQHRSVYLANILAEYFRSTYDSVLVRHRELQ